MGPLTPADITVNSNIQMKPKATQYVPSQPRKDDWAKKLLTLKICAFLRLIYNMLKNLPYVENLQKTLQFLNSKSNLQIIILICE